MKKVLIVEDDEDLLDTLTTFLEEENYQVSSLSSAKKFLQTFNDVQPDFVFLDIRLPDGSGDALAKGLFNHPNREDTKIILMSALDDLPTRAKFAKADCYVRKPFEFSAIEKVLS